MSDESTPADNPFAGVQLVDGTLLIPGDRYVVRKVTVEDVARMTFERGEWEVPCTVHYEVTERAGWHPPSFAVGSG